MTKLIRRGVVDLVADRAARRARRPGTEGKVALVRSVRRIVAADSALRAARGRPGPVVVVEVGRGADPVLRSRRPR